MKNLLTFTLLLLALLLPSTATAHDFEVGGIYYNVNGNEATVTYQGTSYNEYSYEYSGDVIIPSTVTYSGTTYMVTSIGDYAFYRCVFMTSVTIPNSVTTIGDFAFSRCYGLTNIKVESGNPSYDSRDNCNAIIETATNTLKYGCKNTIIPNSVTSIGKWAFYGSGLTSVEIPNSVTTIGEGAFSYCGLTSVEIPNSVTTIWDRAFSGCIDLTSVTIANSVTTIGNYAFEDCSGLTSVEIPNSVTSIGDEAFCFCSGLTSVTIGNSVISIGEGAFYYCSGLTSVTIGNSVISIGEGAFYNCSALTSVTCLAATPPTIGDNSSYAFSSVTSQATLYVPYKSVSAYQSAFNWMDFSQIVGIFDDFEVDGVWYRALDENTAMVIQRPGEEDYYQGDVVIPEDVTYEDQSFTVVCIDTGAFEDCYDLTSVVIGDSVESIGENAFLGCTSLTSVTVGCGVTAIGSKAFNYCNSLQTVTCRGMVPPLMASSNCFTNAAYTRATLRVPRTAESDYSTADYWYKFKIIEGYGSAGPGDVDGDGIIGIADVSTIIDYILYGNSDDEFYFESADINGNGRIDIGDVSTLIDMLLNVD